MIYWIYFWFYYLTEINAILKNKVIIRKNINIDLAYTKMRFYKLFGGEKVLDSIKYPGWNQIDLHSHGLIDLMKDGSERNNNYTNKKFYDFVKE